MAELLSSGYMRIGKECEPFVSEIDVEDANALLETLVTDFYDGVEAKQPVINGDIVKTVAGKSFPHIAITDTETPAKFVGTMLKNYTDIDTWRLLISHSKTRRDPENKTPIRIENRLIIETRNNEIIEAVKRVRIVRTIGKLTVEDIVNSVDDEASGSTSLEKQLLSYERYATIDDVINNIELLEKTAQRAKREKYVKARKMGVL